MMDFSFEDIGLTQNTFAYQWVDMSYSFDAMGWLQIVGWPLSYLWTTTIKGLLPYDIVSSLEDIDIDIFVLLELWSLDAIQIYIKSIYQAHIKKQVSRFAWNNDYKDQLLRDVEYHTCMWHIHNLSELSVHKASHISLEIDNCMGIELYFFIIIRSKNGIFWIQFLIIDDEKPILLSQLINLEIHDHYL
jgi:hypothetical protein